MKKKIALIVALVAMVALVASCASSGAAKAAPAAAASSGSDVKVSLQAKDAKLMTSKDLKMENGNSNIGWWSDLGDKAVWEADIPEDGTYSIEVKYSVDPSFAGAVVNISVGDSMVEWPVISTGGWGNYKSFAAGTVDLKAGATTVTLQAKSIKNRFVANIQRVRLVKQ